MFITEPLYKQTTAQKKTTTLNSIILFGRFWVVIRCLSSRLHRHTAPKKWHYFCFCFFAEGSSLFGPGETFALALALARRLLGFTFALASAVFFFFTIGLRREGCGRVEGWEDPPGLARLSSPTASIALAKLCMAKGKMKRWSRLSFGFRSCHCNFPLGLYITPQNLFH